MLGAAQLAVGVRSGDAHARRQQPGGFGPLQQRDVAQLEVAMRITSAVPCLVLCLVMMGGSPAYAQGAPKSANGQAKKEDKEKIIKENKNYSNDI